MRGTTIETIDPVEMIQKLAASVRLLVVEEQGERHVRVASEEDQRHEQVVPDPDELEDGQRGSGRHA